MASVVLLSLCLLVLFSNYIDRNHTENVKKSISTLYADRLIAEDYILKMTSCLYQIKEVINTDTGNNINKNSRIKNLLLTIKETSNSYHKTKFTELERIKANELLNTLQEIEPTQLKNTQLKLESANKALAILNELSAIQLAESKQIMNYAERLYLSGKTSSQFVFALIIIILIVLQLLVFTSKTLIQKEKTDFPHLN
ncbi:MAG TPA: hypothetical protein VLB84_11100 [Bacteroidia bacterium]|nr:hypothetical protein [Bacteroidia bacterium]